MATKTIQQSIVYSDILPDFDIHPVTGDLIRAINETAVKNSIRNLIQTRKGERRFQPDIGCNVSQFLFEPMCIQTQQDIQDAITQCITNYEPRCQLASVNVVAIDAQDLYQVSITFTILNNTQPITLQTTLQRVR